MVAIFLQALHRRCLKILDVQEGILQVCGGHHDTPSYMQDRTLSQYLLIEVEPEWVQYFLSIRRSRKQLHFLGYTQDKKRCGRLCEARILTK